MARQSKIDKVLDNAYYAAYKRLGDGVQVDMMDMGKMHDEALAAMKNGVSADDAVLAVIAKYRKN